MPSRKTALFPHDRTGSGWSLGLTFLPVEKKLQQLLLSKYVKWINKWGPIALWQTGSQSCQCTMNNIHLLPAQIQRIPQGKPGLYCSWIWGNVLSNSFLGKRIANDGIQLFLTCENILKTKGNILKIRRERRHDWNHWGRENCHHSDMCVASTQLYWSLQLAPENMLTRCFLHKLSGILATGEQRFQR